MRRRPIGSMRSAEPTRSGVELRGLRQVWADVRAPMGPVLTAVRAPARDPTRQFESTGRSTVGEDLARDGPIL
jgi:hypothetical protein